MNRVNYQEQLERVLTKLPPQKKRLLLHSCCAPCSSYVLRYLQEWFEITVFYYNPNITEQEEYERRTAEQERLVEAMNRESEALRGTDGRPDGPAAAAPDELPAGRAGVTPLRFIKGAFEPEVFFQAVKGVERIPEGGERCFRCFELRLRAAARMAQREGYDYFTTTLTISPLKNADRLNAIGQLMADEHDVAFLPSDFKKKNGYKRSVELSQEYGLYRQDYCGCIFSKAERDRRLSEEEDRRS